MNVSTYVVLAVFVTLLTTRCQRVQALGVPDVRFRRYPVPLGMDPVGPVGPVAPVAPIELAGSAVAICWVKEFRALPADVDTVKSRNNAAVKSMADDTAVFVSLYVVAAELVNALISILTNPFVMSVPDAPADAARVLSVIFQPLSVAATVAPVVMLARVMTVPDPHPLTVQSFALNVSVGV